MPDGHTAISNWDSGEPPVPNKQGAMLESFDSDFIDGGIDDALTGVSTCPTGPLHRSAAAGSLSALGQGCLSNEAHGAHTWALVALCATSLSGPARN